MKATLIALTFAALSGISLANGFCTCPDCGDCTNCVCEECSDCEFCE